MKELVNRLYLPENSEKQKLTDVRMPKDGDDGFFLITGSSNSTIDKIVLRLLRTGLVLKHSGTKERRAEKQ
nr:hypothetical protein [Tanacetum cinerariifolium]